jgi:hypothetical protein
VVQHSPVPTEPPSRSEEFAAEFEAAQDEFISLIESLTDAEWRMVGQNYPQRINEEDEGRTIGVIAHHVADDGPWVVQRIEDAVAGRQSQPPDKQRMNAEHARDQADVTRDEVLRLLRETKPTIAASLRAIPEDRLDLAQESPAGLLTVAFRIQAVLIGHIKMHQGSIEVAIANYASPPPSEAGTL